MEICPFGESLLNHIDRTLNPPLLVDNFGDSRNGIRWSGRKFVINRPKRKFYELGKRDTGCGRKKYAPFVMD